MSKTVPPPPQNLDLELVLASILGGVVVLDREETILFVNPAAETILERSSSMLVGRKMDEIYRLAPWLRRLTSRLADEPEATLRGEGRIYTPNGGRVVAVVAVLRDRRGSATGTVVMLHDLGARQWLYDEEHARIRLAELDTIVSRFAHELNNPLAGIRGAAQLLAGKATDDGELRRYAEMIVRQADRMSELISGLLSLESPPPAMDSLNIHRVLNEVLLLVRPEADTRGVELTTEFDPSLPAVRGDDGQLQQLFLNLLKNAVAAAPPRNGHVAVSTRIETRFYVETPARRVRYILVDVRDNGPGLDEATRARMFTPFFSRREGGLGLGLAIAHNIATAHGGRIVAENNESGGACLRVALPVAESKQSHAGEDIQPDTTADET